MPAALRLFFALWPDAAARDAIAVLARDVRRRCDGRVPRPENVHLTLAFLGDVAPDRVDALAVVGAAAAGAVPPFVLTLDRLGGFRDAGIAWLGTDRAPAPLAELARRLAEGLAADGFRVERRPFAAHVTLARKCRAPPPQRERVAAVSWPVDALSLVASQPAAGGSRYHTLGEWTLGQAP
jgi:2'-5' RNA ligase